MKHDPNDDDGSYIAPQVDLPKPPTSRRPTMMYSYVGEEEAKKMHGGTGALIKQKAALAPTVEMESVQLMTVFTVQTVVSLIIERDMNAWAAFSQSIRDLILSKPEHFAYTQDDPADLPTIHYKGVSFKWNYKDSWVLVTIGGA